MPGTVPPSREKPPKRMRREERITAILGAARAVFEESGYEGAKVADIADRLGVTEGNIYAFFDSKRDLMLAVIAEWYRTTVDPLLRAVPGITGTDNKLRFVIWHHLKTMIENAALCAVVLKESRTVGEERLTTELHELRRQYTEPLMRVLADGVRSGELAPGLELSLVRNLVYGTLEHVLWDSLATSKPVDVEHTADALTAAILSGILGPALAPPRADEEAARLGVLLDRMERALDAREAPASSE